MRRAAACVDPRKRFAVELDPAACRTASPASAGERSCMPFRPSTAHIPRTNDVEPAHRTRHGTPA